MSGVAIIDVTSRAADMAKSANQASFGRHESFPLRFGWLTKGFQVWINNPDVFEQEDAVVLLGVGENMVSAIRYWMIASQIALQDGPSLRATEFGSRIFSCDGWDPYLEDDETIWLIHWNLASNAGDATSLFWFFNKFHKPEFTAQELIGSLSEFARGELRSKVNDATLKSDITLLLRMYERTQASKAIPIEEALDSPYPFYD